MQLNIAAALPESSVEKANFHHLVIETFWFGIAWAAYNRFLAVFAIRLHATPLELGLITSLPWMIFLFSSFLGAWWLRREPRPIKAIILPSLLFRTVFLLPAFAPLLPPAWRPFWLILGAALPAIPQGIGSVIFLVALRSSVHDALVPLLHSRRMLVFNLGVAAAAASFGMLLEYTPYPTNYQVVFIIAFLCALMGLWHVAQLRAVRSNVTPLDDQRHASPLREPEFRRVMLITAAIHLSYCSILPIIPLWLVSNLRATEGFIALFSLVELVAGALVALVTSRLASRIGTHKMIAVSMIGCAFAALAIALAPSLNWTLLGAALSGIAWTAAVVGIYSLFNERAPVNGMARYTTIFNQTIGLTTSIGSMIGSGLASLGVGLALVLMVGAGLRLLAGAITDPHILHAEKRSVRAVAEPQSAQPPANSQ